MRIISKGQIPEERLVESICNKCKTVFEYALKEAKYTSDRDGDFYTVACPLCGDRIYTDVKALKFKEDVDVNESWENPLDPFGHR
jgi:RNase P subunit RPR2